MAASSSMQFALGALAPFITAELGLARTAFGAASSVLFASGLVFSLVAGRLLGRWGDVTELRVLHALVILAFAIVALAPSLPLIVAGAAVMGVALGLGNPATNAFIAHHVDANVRGTATGLKQSGVQLGALVVGLSAPPLAAVLGWRIAIASVAVIAVLGLVTTGLVRGSPRTARLEEPEATRGRGISPLTFRLVVYASFMGWGVSGIVAFLPLYAYDELGAPAHLAGMLTGLISGLGAASRVGAGVLGNASREHWPWLVAHAIAAAAAAPLLLLATAWPAVIWLAVIGLGVGALGWQTPAMLAVVRHEPRPAHSSGLVMAGFFAGMLGGPLVFGWLADSSGSYTFSWLGVTLAFVLAASVGALSNG